MPWLYRVFQNLHRRNFWGQLLGNFTEMSRKKADFENIPSLTFALSFLYVGIAQILLTTIKYTFWKSLIKSAYNGLTSWHPRQAQRKGYNCSTGQLSVTSWIICLEGCLKFKKIAFCHSNQEYFPSSFYKEATNKKCIINTSPRTNLVTFIGLFTDFGDLCMPYTLGSKIRGGVKINGGSSKMRGLMRQKQRNVLEGVKSEWQN